MKGLQIFCGVSETFAPLAQQNRCVAAPSEWIKSFMKMEKNLRCTADVNSD